MNRSLPKLLAVTLLIAAPSIGYCEELPDLLARVQKLANEKNFPKALEELSWAQKEIQKLHSNELGKFFPDEIGSFKGEKIKTNAALGFSQVERSYKAGDRSISVALTGGSSSGGLGNLAQLGKFAAMMGAESGQETLRIQGRTAQMEGEEGEHSTLTIFLESGSVLKLDANKGISTSDLKEFANSLHLEELDKYLKG